MQASPARLLHQESILHDALECHSPAAPRLVELITRMQSTACESIGRGEKLAFPRRMLADPQDGHHLPEPHYDQNRVFPRSMLESAAGRGAIWESPESLESATSLAALAGAAPQLELSSEQNIRQWQHVIDEAAANRRADVAQATDALRRELDQARWDLAWARREIKRLQRADRNSLSARLGRLRSKLSGLLMRTPNSDRDTRDAA
jgi:hypothetical protein